MNLCARPQSYRISEVFCARRCTALVLACLYWGMSADAQATTYCAHDRLELIADLTAVSTGGGANGHDNTIHLVNGTFATSGATFAFNSVSGFALTIDGGYDSTCASHDPTPNLTMLDGGDAEEVLSIQTNGTITLRHLTIQHGFRNGSSNGGGVGIFLNQLLAADPVPAAVFDADVVRNNSTNYASGGVTVFAPAPDPGNHAGMVSIENSLFVGNSAPNIGALFVDLGPGSTVYLTNNTITGNTCTNGSCSVTALGDPAGLLSGFVSNTIGFGNTATYDFFLYFNSSVEFVHDDYGSISGTPAASSNGNLIGIDPRFAAADDFHLRSTSPLLRAGSLAPPGGLPATDLEGNPRSVANRVDIGAYENVDFIFADGFALP
jgi:hypothetical protein